MAKIRKRGRRRRRRKNVAHNLRVSMNEIEYEGINKHTKEQNMKRKERRKDNKIKRSVVCC